jgi:tripartite ATP-independent transporter DctM subunit
MILKNIAKKQVIITYGLSRRINSVGVCLLSGMVLLIVVDVTLRRFFSRPILGTFEIVQFFLITLVCLALADTAIKDGNIRVELIISKFSEKPKALIQSLTIFLSLLLFILITWRNLIMVWEVWQKNLSSYLLHIPLFPFYFILTFGSGILCIVLFIQLIDSLKTIFYFSQKLSILFIYFLVCILFFFVFFVFFQCIWWQPSPSFVGVLGILCLLVLMAFGMPIAFSMGLVGFAGYCNLMGINAGLGQLQTVPFSVVSEYLLSVVPLFLLMGHFSFHSGLSQDLYDTSYKWLGQYPGGLAMATVGGCATFAAVSGSSVATAATMGMVALPGMKKYNYSPRLALGSIAAGGTIGILIPPSIVFILYGIMTEQSIGKLFLAGFFPGLLTIFLYFITILILVKLNPKMGPPGPKTNLKAKFFSLRHTWGMLFLFLLIMGGIYLGFFTPTEAGAVGAFGAFVLAVFRKKFDSKKIYDSLLQTGQTTAMLIIIFVGAQLFNYFLAATNLPTILAEAIANRGLDRNIVLLAILSTYLLLGCIMDPGSMIILTIPIFFPLIQTMGFHPIWFGVLIVMVAEIGAITPPIGINVFVVKGIAPDTSTTEIFKGIFPFWVADIIRLSLVVLVPHIALYLPYNIE